MTLKEILDAASLHLKLCTAGGISPSPAYAGIEKLFATPPECGWPKPEVFVDGMGKYAVWEALGLTPIKPDELRSIVALLGRALVEIEP